MPAMTKKQASEEFVKERYPNAFIDDDGERVMYVRYKTRVTTPCRTCGQQWTRDIAEVGACLSSAGNDFDAWKRAAEALCYK